MFLTRLGLRVEGRDQRRRDADRPRRPDRQSGLAVVEEILDGHRRASRSATWAGATSCGTRSCRTSWRPTAAFGDSRARGSKRREPHDDDDGHPRDPASPNRQSAPLDEDGLDRARARDAARRGPWPTVELSVSFVDEDEIDRAARALHGRTRSHRRALVPARRGRSTRTASRVLGDVVIAPAVAARNNPDDPDGRAPAAPRARHPAPARLRPRGGRRARRDVGATGALQRGEASRDGSDWFEIVVIVLLIVVVALTGGLRGRASRARTACARCALVEEGRRGAALLVAHRGRSARRYLNVGAPAARCSCTIGGDDARHVARRAHFEQRSARSSRRSS